VDCDRSQHEAECERRQPGQVAPEAAEGEAEGGHEQPAVQQEAYEAGLRRNGHRSRVRGGRVRVPALQVRQLGVRALEAADAYSHDGVVHRDAGSVPDQLPAPARRALAAAVAEDVVPHARDRERAGADDYRRDGGECDAAPTPRERRRDHHADRERGEARLRVREEQSDPDRSDRRGRADQQPAVTAEEHGDEAGEDGDGEEASVDRRVPEDRVDAVERCVGVRDEQLRVPEDVARLVLVDPDSREDDRHRRHLDEQAERDQPAPPEAREHDREQAEWQVEEEQVDRALAHVARPEDREPGPRHESGERPGHRPKLAGAGITLDELPRKQQRGRRDDGVERHQQVRLGRADGYVDACRDTREHEEREHERPAAKRHGSGRRERDPDDRRRAEQRPVSRRGQVEREQQRPERPTAEADEPQRSPGGNEQEREPGGADHPSGAGELGGHRVTTRTARAVWPLAATRTT